MYNNKTEYYYYKSPNTKQKLSKSELKENLLKFGINESQLKCFILPQIQINFLSLLNGKELINEIEKWFGIDEMNENLNNLISNLENNNNEMNEIKMKQNSKYDKLKLLSVNVNEFMYFMKEKDELKTLKNEEEINRKMLLRIEKNENENKIDKIRNKNKEIKNKIKEIETVIENNKNNLLLKTNIMNENDKKMKNLCKEKKEILLKESKMKNIKEKLIKEINIFNTKSNKNEMIITIKNELLENNRQLNMLIEENEIKQKELKSIENQLNEINLSNNSLSYEINNNSEINHINMNEIINMCMNLQSLVKSKSSKYNHIIPLIINNNIFVVENRNSCELLLNKYNEKYNERIRIYIKDELNNNIIIKTPPNTSNHILSILNYPIEIENVLKRHLHNWCIVKDIDDGIKIRNNKDNNYWNIICENGIKLLNNGELFVNKNNNNNTLNININDLKKEYNENIDKIKHYEIIKTNIMNEIKEKDNKIIELRNENKIKTKKLNEYEEMLKIDISSINIEENKIKIKEIEDNENMMNKEKKSYNKEIQQLKDEIKKNKIEIEEIEEKINENELKMSEYNNIIKSENNKEIKIYENRNMVINIELNKYNNNNSEQTEVNRKDKKEIEIKLKEIKYNINEINKILENTSKNLKPDKVEEYVIEMKEMKELNKEMSKMNEIIQEERKEIDKLKNKRDNLLYNILEKLSNELSNIYCLLSKSVYLLLLMNIVNMLC